MFKALLVFRPLNLLILAATQWLIYYFLGAGSQSVLLIFILSAATLSIAAAGNLLNDYFDRERDEVNKPGQNYAAFWVEHKLIWPTYVFLNLSAIYLGFQLNSWLAWMMLFIAAIMFLYNYSWKDLPVLGNLTISFLVAFSILLVRIIQEDIEPKLLLYYAMFAMFLTWARELVKDLEDRKGDLLVGSQNMTISTSAKGSLMFFRLLIVFVLALLVSAWPIFKSFLPLNVHTTVITYSVLCIALPMIYLIGMSYRAELNYSDMSRISKYTMVTGVLSLLFF
jgi:4-hydroxybenzoate polyprenyltransferase